MRHIGSKKIQMSLIKEDVIEDNVTVRENIKEEYITQNDEPEDMNVVKVNDIIEEFVTQLDILKEIIEDLSVTEHKEKNENIANLNSLNCIPCSLQ